MIEVDGIDDLARDLAAAPIEVRRKAVKVLIDTGGKVAATQRSLTRSSTTRAKITVRPDKRGSRGGSAVFSVHIGPSYTTEGANLPWIEEYGTSRQAPHPYIGPSLVPHAAGMVAGLEEAIGDL